MGGQTTSSSGSANSGVAYGGTEDDGQNGSGGEDEAKGSRAASGYGGDEDMDKSIGA